MPTVVRDREDKIPRVLGAESAGEQHQGEQVPIYCTKYGTPRVRPLGIKLSNTPRISSNAKA
jgi:hypothetical protein